MNTVVASSSSVLTNIVLPLVGLGLLVPNAAVAEVVLAGQLSSAVSSPFLLGYMVWREQEIPVVSFEGLLDGHLPEGIALRQMAILHGITDRQNMPFFALVLSAVPRLVRLRDSDIVPVNARANPLVHSQVRAVDLTLMIPDWDRFETEIIAVL
jgi:chemotaxis signal transduction protein